MLRSNLGGICVTLIVLLAYGCSVDPSINSINKAIIDPTDPQGKRLILVPDNPATPEKENRRGNIFGGDIVVIRGSHFGHDTNVLIDGNPILNKKVTSSGRITGIVPVGKRVGRVNVKIRNRNGTDELDKAWEYVSTGVLSITDITPNVADVAGGTEVRITGTGFLAPVGRRNPGTVIRFGNPTTGLELVDAEVIDFFTIVGKTPSANQGTVDVCAVNPDGFFCLQNGFSFLACADPTLPLTVTSLAPAQGTVAGGTTVTITGQGLSDDVRVFFGGKIGSNFDNSGAPCSLDVDTPPGDSPIAVDVIIDNPFTNESVTIPLGFTYTAIGITSITPDQGPLSGGTSVTVIGAGFVPFNTILNVDGVQATSVNVIDANTLTAITPAGMRADVPVDVEVQTPEGSALLPQAFTYLALSFTSIEPNFSTLAGGVPVLLSGTGLDTTSRVLIGGADVTNLAVDSQGFWVTGTVPPGAAPGPVNVTVVIGTGEATLSDGFVYDPGPPIVEKITPNFAARMGGETVLIEGENFTTAPLNLSIIFDSGAGGDDAVADNLVSPSVQIVSTTRILVEVPDKTVASNNLEVCEVGGANAIGTTSTPQVFAYAEWQSPGPLGGFITGIEVDEFASNHVFVSISGRGLGGTGGIYETTNGGVSWARIDNRLDLPLTPPQPPDFDELPDSNINSIALARRNAPGDALWIYVGTPMGLFRSEDGGSVWTQASDPDLGSRPILSVAVDPNDTTGNRIFCGSESSQAFFSSTGGASSSSALLDRVPTDGFVFDVTAVTVSRSSGNVYWGTSGDGVWTWNGSGTATHVTGSTPIGNLFVQSIEDDPFGGASDRIYAGTVGAGVFIYNGASNAWAAGGAIAPSTPAPLVYMLAADPSAPNVLYAAIDDIGGGNSGIWKSVNGGSAFTEMSTGLQISGEPAEMLAVAVDGLNTQNVWAGAIAGVFSSTNGATSWAPRDSGISNTNVEALVGSTTGTTYAGTFGAGVYESLDGGLNWALKNGGSTLTATRVQALAFDSAGNIYAGTSDGGIFLSNNAGVSWTAENAGLNTAVEPLKAMKITAIAVDPENDANVFIGTDGEGVWTTTAGGLPGIVWNKLTGSLLLGQITDDKIRSMHVTSTIIRFRDPQVDPVDCVAFPPPATSCDTACQPAYPLKHIFAGTEEDGIFSSTDNGLSWQDMSSGLTSLNVQAITSGVSCVTDPELDVRLAENFFVYVGTKGGGVFRGVAASDIIENPFAPGTFIAITEKFAWNPLNSGLTDLGVNDLTVDPTTPSNIFVGTENGGVFVTGNGGVQWRMLNPGVTPLTPRGTLTNSRVRATGLVLDATCGVCTNVLAGTAGGGCNRIRILKQ